MLALEAHDAFLQPTRARLFQERQPAGPCLEKAGKNTATPSSAEGFTDIAGGRAGAEHPGHSEVRLFSILGHWSEAEGRRQQPQVRPENKCKVLGEALALIRFPLMTLEESAAEPPQKGILGDREAGSLFPHLTVRPQPHKDYHPPGALLPPQEGVRPHEQPPAGGEPLGVLSINKSIFVVGFGLCGSIHGPTDYHVNIQIIHMDRPRARTPAVSAVRAPHSMCHAEGPGLTH